MAGVVHAGDNLVLDAVVQYRQGTEEADDDEDPGRDEDVHEPY